MSKQCQKPLPHGGCYLDGCWNDIMEEVQRASAKFPDWPVHVSDGVMIVLEEAGEAAKAAVDVRWGRASLIDLRAELIQTAAMCKRMILAIDRGHIESEGG